MNNHVGQCHHALCITKNKELIEIYLSVALRMLAFSFVGVFVPVYFIKELGFAVSKVMVFYLCWAIITILIIPLVAKLAARFGFKKIMVASAPFAIAYLLLLNMMKDYNVHYIWVAFFSALTMQLFWMGFHIDFSQCSDKKKRAEEVGWWYSILMAVGFVGPIVGAVIIKYIGFQMLFLVATLIMLLSSVPVLFSKVDTKPKDFSITAIFRREYLKDFVVYTAYGTKELASSFIWPLFIFLILNDVVKLGAISSAVSLASAISLPLIGKITDGHKRNSLLRNIGSLIDGISWPLRILLNSFTSLMSVSLISFLSFLLVDVQTYKKFYDTKKNPIGYMVMRETALATGRIIALLAVMALGFYASFWLIGLSNLAYLLF